MHLLAENSVDASKEKHVPVIEKLSDTHFKVKVGSVPHPMEEKHHIGWIELIVDGRSYIQFLNSGGPPEAEFCFKSAVSNVTARAYCNLHGLWKA
jgi:superoxide reductase